MTEKGRVQVRQINEIQADIDSTERAKQAGGVDQNQINVWNMQIADFKKELVEAEANQQHLEARVEQAKETGYILDTIEINGLPAIAFSHTPENHELLAIAVQKWGLAQEDAFNTEVEKYQTIAHEKNSLYLTEKEINDDLNKSNIQMALDITELNNKLRNAAAIIEEKDAEIKRLQEQQSIAQAVPVAPLSAEEQDTKLIADLMGNRLKVTDIRFKDESGIDRRKVLANNALTGEEIEEYAIYSITRWEEVSLVEAAQLQADYALKKAEIEAQNAVIPTLDSPIIEPVTEVVEPVTEIPFQESDQVDSQNSGTNTQGEGNQTVESLVGQPESEVITLESLKAEVDAIKSHLGLVA